MTELFRIVLLVSCLGFQSCHTLNEKLGLPDDNLAEETIEEVAATLIEQKTGYRPYFDLTPDSPEK